MKRHTDRQTDRPIRTLHGHAGGKTTLKATGLTASACCAVQTALTVAQTTICVSLLQTALVETLRHHQRRPTTHNTP